MSIIFRLTLRYMKQNRRRTLATTLGIALAVCALTAVVVFASSFTWIARQLTIEEEGAWHVRFHQVTEEQEEAIKGWKKAKKSYPAKNCREHEGGRCIDVEMRHPGIDTQKAAQQFAEQIGMPQLPEEEREILPDHTVVVYDETYNSDLLEYYGVFSRGSEGVAALFVSILIVIMLLSSVFIYNAFAVSAFEKMRYIGLLGSVGATKMQKSACILLEGLLEGAVGTLIGIAIGLAASRRAVGAAGLMMLGSQNLKIVFGPKVLLAILACSATVILAACTIPSSRAANATLIDLLIRPYPQRLDGQKITSLKKEHKIIGVEGAIALKNIFLKEKQYSACIGILSLSLCILLDGTVALKMRAGEYDVKDLRERPSVAMWAELECDDGKMQEFYDKTASMEEIKSISLERVLDFSGILADDADVVSAEPNTLRIKDTCGQEKTGNKLEVKVIGLDEKTFADYAEKAGITVEADIDKEEYPVIIEDYMLGIAAKGKGIQYEYGRFLREMNHERLSFVYSKYGDMSEWGMEYDPVKDAYQVDELLEGSFFVLGTTTETPPYPYYAGYKESVNGYDGYDNGDKLRVYMTAENFSRFLNDPAYQSTYGVHPTDTVLLNYDEDKNVQSCLTFDIARESTKKKWTGGEVKYLHKDLKMRMKEDEAFRPKLNLAAKEAGISKKDYFFGSAAKYELKRSRGSENSIIQILGYGAIALILACSLTSILQKISTSTRTRRKEFAMLMSMGMTRKSLKKMIAIENSAYGLLTGALGIPFSIFLMNSQFSDYAFIVKKIPYHVIGLEILIVILLSLFPVIFGIRQLGTLNIIKDIQDEVC